MFIENTRTRIDVGDVFYLKAGEEIICSLGKFIGPHLFTVIRVDKDGVVDMADFDGNILPSVSNMQPFILKYKKGEGFRWL
jgi:hypothetical protein